MIVCRSGKQTDSVPKTKPVKSLDFLHRNRFFFPLSQRTSSPLILRIFLPLFSVILKITQLVLLWLKAQDVTFGEVVSGQQAQYAEQSGAHLHSWPKVLLHGSVAGDGDHQADEVGEGGKSDASRQVVMLGRIWHHKGAEEGENCQEAMVAVEDGKSNPGLDFALEEDLGREKFVVSVQKGRRSIEISDGEQNFNQETPTHNGPRSSLGKKMQGVWAAVTKIIGQHDLEGFDSDGGKTSIESKSTHRLLQEASGRAGLPNIEAAAESHQGEAGERQETHGPSRGLHCRGLEVSQEEHPCQAGESEGKDQQTQQGDHQGLGPVEVSFAAVVAPAAALRRPLVLRADTTRGVI